MDIFTQLYTLYPDLEEEYRNNDRLFIIQDDMNGDGPYISEWNHQTLTKPTQSQLPVYRDYRLSSERLSKYILSEGRPEIREDVVVRTEKVLNEETGEIETVNVTENVVIQTAIEPLEENIEVTTTDPETLEVTTESVRNPLIVKDEEERAAAQAIVDATPQSVIDAINN